MNINQQLKRSDKQTEGCNVVGGDCCTTPARASDLSQSSYSFYCALTQNNKHGRLFLVPLPFTRRMYKQAREGLAMRRFTNRPNKNKNKLESGRNKQRRSFRLTLARGLSSSFLSASRACFLADRTSDLDETSWGMGLPEERRHRRRRAHTTRIKAQLTNLPTPNREEILHNGRPLCCDML